MFKVNYSQLSDEQLAQKEKENKVLVLLSVVTLFSLVYDSLREYLAEDKVNVVLIVLLILAIIGSVHVFMRVKEVRQQKKVR